MDPKNVFECAIEGLKWLTIGGAGYFAILEGLQFLNAISPFNEKIKDQAHLERVVKERALKLGLDSSKIDVKYNWMGDTYADKKGERDILSLGSGLGCTRDSVDHELYHILKRDCDRKKEKGFHYYFVREPRATLYQVFGIKL